MIEQGTTGGLDKEDTVGKELITLLILLKKSALPSATHSFFLYYFRESLVANFSQRFCRSAILLLAVVEAFFACSAADEAAEATSFESLHFFNMPYLRASILESKELRSLLSLLMKRKVSILFAIIV